MLFEPDAVAEYAELVGQMVTSTLIEPLRLPPLGPAPLVSVLVANYNYAHMLPQALDSVLSQSYRKVEVIVCDDGSTDRSISVLESYAVKDDRIRFVAQANAGMAAAWNRAYEMSRGAVICLLDADDYFDKDKVEVVVRAFATDVQAGLALHRIRMVDSRRRALGMVPLFGELPSGWFGNTIVGAFWGTAPNGSAGSAISFRRQVGDKVFPLDPCFSRNADTHLLNRCFLVTVVAGINRCLGSYRVHGSNVTHSAHVSRQRVLSDLETEDRLWNDQRRFAGFLDPRCLVCFPQFESKVSVLRLLYLKMIIEGAADITNVRSRLIRHPHFRSAGMPTRLAWRALYYLPRWAVPSVAGPLLGGSRVRGWISRIKAAVGGYHGNASPTLADG